MDIFSSPLNLAHQEGRKAERLMRANKFEEAIECHKKAQEYLQAALLQTHCEEAITSIKLQHKSEETGQKRIILQLKKSTLQTSSQPLKTSKRNMDSETDLKLSEVDGGEITSRYDLALKTITECDSLLQFLENRAESLYPTNTAPSRVASLRPLGIKMPKDDKLILEELRLINDALRQHVQELLQEVENSGKEKEDLRKENLLLKARLAKLEGKKSEADTIDKSADDYYPFPDGLNVEDLSSMALPPLEMPMFDFGDMKGIGQSDGSPPNKSD